MKEGRFSKITRRMWGDAKFVALSAPEPNARYLWIYLLTGRHNTIIPGLFIVGEMSLADELGWPVDALRRCLTEILDARMAFFDRQTRLFWLPNAVRHNEPDSPNVLVKWREAFVEFPDSDLLQEAKLQLEAFFETLGPEWFACWERGEGRATRLPITPDVRSFVQDRDGSICRYCGCEVNWKDRRGPMGATYDHVDPAGNSTEANIVVSCRKCNSLKGFRTPVQAGMTLMPPRSKPKSRSRSHPESYLEPEQEQEQESDQEQEQEQQSRTAGQSVGSHTNGKPNGATDLPPEELAIRTEIQRHSVFSMLDAAAMAKTHAGRMVVRPQPLAWVVAAIDECAAKSEGQGLSAGALQGKLVGFMRNAREPKNPPVTTTNGTTIGPKKVIEIRGGEETPEQVAERRRRAEERQAQLAKLAAQKPITPPKARRR